MKHSRLLAGVSASAIVLACLAVPSNAAPPGSGGTGLSADSLHAARKTITRSRLSWLPATTDPNQVVKVIVEVNGPSVASAEGDAKDAGTAFGPAQEAQALADAAAPQGRVANLITQRGGRVERTTSSAINSITAEVKAADLETLAASADVVNVSPVRTYHLDNANSDATTGVNQVWSSYGGTTGAGVKIAIIDDGIDYTHADFGGSGNPDDYTAIDPVDAAPAGVFPNDKVIGGYDFVGDAYDALATDPANRVPHPDPNPLGCGEHGTHVAGTAAGFGVKDGATYHGPYDGSIDLSTFAVAPGSAPEAKILAYKVFGCDGSVDNDVIIAAIDRAVADGADVINMSLGADYGTADEPDAVAADNAVRAGVVVVTSAGNEGPASYMVGSPSTGHRVISVAAIDAVPTFPGAEITGTALTNPIEAIHANTAPLAPLTGTLYPLLNSDGSLSLGCDPAEYKTAPAGVIYLVLRGTCARVDRPKWGEEAGGAGVIMVNNADSLPPYEGEIPGVTIPFIGVAPAAQDALLAAAGSTITITDTGAQPSPTYRAAASFTSGGPRGGDGGQKPDLAAPGVSVKSAGRGTGTDAFVISGTSMASPHTAGIAALVRQRHPHWTAAQVKAALVATADASALNEFNTLLDGNGLVNPAGAIATPVLLSTPGGDDAINFGIDELDGGSMQVRQLRLTNVSDHRVTYKFSVTPNSAMRGAKVDVLSGPVTVWPGQRRDVFVRLWISRSDAAKLPPIAGDSTITTVRGQIVATPVDPAAPTLHEAFLWVPHPRSDVEPGRIKFAKDGKGGITGQLVLRNQGLIGGDTELFTLLSTDRKARGTTADARALGVRYIGFDPTTTDGVVLLAVSNWDRYNNGAATYADLYFDTPLGIVNVFAADEGFATTGTPSGDMATFVILPDGSGFIYPAFQSPDGSVLELPFFASDMGLTRSTPSATLVQAATGYIVDGSADLFDGASATINPFTQASTNGYVGVIAPNRTVSLTLTQRAPGTGEVPPLGWMVLNFDDHSGPSQADLITAR